MQDDEYVLMIRESGITILVDDVRFDGSISFFAPNEGKFYAFAHPLINNVDPVGKNAYFSFPIWRANSGYDAIDAFVFNDFDVAKMGFGVVTQNTSHGIEGDFNGMALANIDTYPVDVASRPKLGFAQVFATLEDGENHLVDILLLFRQKGGAYVFKVIDKGFLDEYGGILFGMSGSPILQDGKMIGALAGTSPDFSGVGFMTSIKDILE